MDSKRLEKLQDIQDWYLSKPKSNKEWVEDVKQENLDIKFDYQLEEMLVNHVKGLNAAEVDLDTFTSWPDVPRFEIFNQLKNSGLTGQELLDTVEEEFESRRLYCTWKVAKLDQSVERIAKEIELRASGLLDVKDTIKIEGDDPRRIEFDTPGSMKRSPIGTTYYIDADNGANGNAGTSTGAAWDTLDQFTENARSAGDVAILRGGMSDGYDDGTDLNFTSSGTSLAPIKITADYGNAFGDHVDLSGTATATITFGSKTITFSSDVSGVLAAGDIIYANGDDNLLHSYEVSDVSTTTVTLYLPYRGNQDGSGKTMYNMQNPPHWQDSEASDFQWNFDTDSFWAVFGVKIRGTDANGNVEIDSCAGHNFMNCIFIGNGSSDTGVYFTDDVFFARFYGCRFYNHFNTFNNNADVFGRRIIVNSLIDSASLVNSTTTVGTNNCYVDELYVETEIKNVSNFISQTATGLASELRGRNLKITASSSAFDTGAGNFKRYLIEDYQGTVGNTKTFDFNISDTLDDTPVLESETTTVRSGGSNVSIKVTPGANLSTSWEFGKLQIFEIPLYATTSSKTYTVYFKNSATTDWTADPTATELWIELEAWGHASNNFRKITKSTGTIDFNGNTVWQSLTVTVAPSQTGVAYLRCYYAKTKESGKSNVFFVDPIPVIT